MPNFIFAYHGGKAPNPEDMEKEMAAWGTWFAGMGASVVDGGNPVGPSKTVTAGGVKNDGGANPISGYSVISADNIEAAIEMAKGCPILKHGSVEVAETMKM